MCIRDRLPGQGLIHGILFIFRPIRRRLMITAQPESRRFYLYRIPPSEKPSGSLRIRVEQLHHRPGQRHREEMCIRDRSYDDQNCRPSYGYSYDNIGNRKTAQEPVGELAYCLLYTSRSYY